MAAEVQFEVKLLEDLQEETLSNCHVALRKKLDVHEVISRLDEKNLLTSEDRHFLLQDSGTRFRENKVDYIVDMLPRKGKGWWEKFITSLHESTSGTAHEYLASTLTSQLKRKIYESDPQLLDMYYRTCIHEHNDMHNAQVPSGISLDVHKFMTEHTNQWESRPDPKNVAILKERLNDIEYCYKIMKNQVALLKAFDELIENIKHFCNAFFNLLKFYVEKFKTKKRQNCLQLTVVEQNVIHIIEDITESTEDIDIDKEREEWAQCVIKIEIKRDIIKEALYSQDTNKMAAVQETLKLKGVEAKAAKEWIVARNQLVEIGNYSLDKLDEMRNQDNTLITSVYEIIQKRVKVGEDCLKAWSRWVEQRIKL